MLTKDDATKILLFIRAVDRFIVHNDKYNYKEMKQKLEEINGDIVHLLTLIP